MDALRHLIERNVASVRRAAALVAELDDAVYTAAGPGFEQGPVGTQVRHIVDYYDCFLAGLAAGHVDYDRRRRDHRVETDRALAADRLAALADALADLETSDLRAPAHGIPATAPLTVTADALDERPPAVPSSVERELLFLVSHTIHHFAVIALVLTALDVEVDDELGVAPSTLRHWTRSPDAAR